MKLKKRSMLVYSIYVYNQQMVRIFFFNLGAPAIPITGELLYKLIDANWVNGRNIQDKIQFFCSMLSLGFWVDFSSLLLYHTEYHVFMRMFPRVQMFRHWGIHTLSFL